MQHEPAEYVILGLLKERPMHGYEMFQQFECGTLGQIVHLEMSQMYAFLKKLERLTYIEAQLEPQGVRPPRKVHHLTTLGDEAFLTWLAQAVEKPRDVRILFLIKLYFVQRYAPTQIATLVDAQITACQRFLTHLEEQQHAEVQSSDEAFFHHVVLSSRVYQTRALLDWLVDMQQQLAS
ncbi:MAG TPA: helix-turn-helix transcriptional regulator [Ktedonobacteraceae bacterium]|jgi:DNA-binding PadR family transcriptional regulator|nr:helix-turn-helix transcriptional regulator [Ktedonobacteraceae bacterium]